MTHSFHHALMKAYCSFHRFVMEQAKTIGLTSGQPKILELLSERDGVEQKTIAAHCEIETATAGSILSRMESAGLIERRRHDGNRRSIFVYLTEDGRKAAAEVAKIFKECEERALKDIPADDREKLRAFLIAIHDNTAGKEAIW